MKRTINQLCGVCVSVKREIEREREEVEDKEILKLPLFRSWVIHKGR